MTVSKAGLFQVLFWGFLVLPGGERTFGGGVKMQHPPWLRDAVLYEVNLRQYTPEGTINAFLPHLERLQELGVDILWLMPVHPIGQKNRKGSLGSYYSVRDYRAVDPGLGSLEDLRQLVRRAHARGFRVILDWVANHCAWDNSLVTAHPSWFVRDEKGRMKSPVPDWSDVVDFDYTNPDLWDYMISSLEFWLEETGVDGFRCDVAGMVPTEFWEEARRRLEERKQVFLLAEWDDPALHRKAFDASYDWKMHKLMNRAARGQAGPADFREHLREDLAAFPPEAVRLQFTSNHDENSWNGTARERLGAAWSLFTVMSFTLTGMPLIYGGQEAGLDHRLKFFDKDTILWRRDQAADLYRRLISLKHTHEALENAPWGGVPRFVSLDGGESLLGWSREKNGDRVVVVVNLAGRSALLRSPPREVAAAGLVPVDANFAVLDFPAELPPWGYLIWTQKK